MLDLMARHYICREVKFAAMFQIVGTVCQVIVLYCCEIWCFISCRYFDHKVMLMYIPFTVKVHRDHKQLKHGVQRRMISVDIFFVFLRSLVFALLLLSGVSQ